MLPKLCALEFLMFSFSFPFISFLSPILLSYFAVLMKYSCALWTKVELIFLPLVGSLCSVKKESCAVLWWLLTLYHNWVVRGVLPPPWPLDNPSSPWRAGYTCVLRAGNWVINTRASGLKPLTHVTGILYSSTKFMLDADILVLNLYRKLLNEKFKEVFRQMAQ